MRRTLLGLPITLFLAMAAIIAAGDSSYLIADGENKPRPADGMKIVPVSAPLKESNVPAILAQGKFLAAQSVSAVDISGDGRCIAVTTMAFRHDRNCWAISDEGKILWGRYVLPWAPYQVAAPKGDAFAVGLAYSRVTPPHPTIALFRGEKGEETVLTDGAGERAWLRYGSGDWRTGWLVSALGDQLVRAGDSAFTISTSSGAWQLTEGGPGKVPPPFPTQRPYRIAASSDGRVVAFGYIVPDVSRLEKGTVPEALRTSVPPPLVSVRGTGDWKESGTVKPSQECFVENHDNEARNPIAVDPDAITLAIGLWENRGVFAWCNGGHFDTTTPQAACRSMIW